MARFACKNSLGAGWSLSFLDNEGSSSTPGFLGVLYHANTAERTYTFPDKDGTVALTSDALVNPMTTLGDLIVGGASGVPARLAKGSDGQGLVMVSGAPAWGNVFINNTTATLLFNSTTYRQHVLAGGPELITAAAIEVSDVLLWGGLPADANARFLLSASGNMEWGAGGSDDQDTAFFRAGPGAMTVQSFTVDSDVAFTVRKASAGTGAEILGVDTTNSLVRMRSVTVNGADGAATVDIKGEGFTVLRVTQSQASEPAFAATVDGDTNLRFSFLANGAMTFGPGNAVHDTELYRTTVGTLRVGGTGGGHLVLDGTLTPGAATTARASIHIPDGVAPSTPAAGDMWQISGQLYWQDATTTQKVAVNPMTAAGDIIIGGVSGSPTRLAKGTDGQVLGMVSGDPAWTNIVGGVLFGGSTQEGAVNLDAADGFRVRAKVGATNDLALVNPANTVRYMNVPTGTSIPVFPQGVIAPASIVGFTAKGTGTPASLSYLLFQGYDTQNNYLQNNVQNLSSGGAASSDWIATRDNGTDATGYIDMGINSSGFSGPGVVNGAGAGYLYVADGDLSIGTDTAGRDLRFFAGGTTIPENIGLTISGDEEGVTALTFGGPAFFKAATTTAPSLNVPAGTAPATPASGDVWNVGGKAKWHDGTRVIALTDATSSLTGNGATSVDPVGITAAKINLTGDATLNMAAGGYDTQRLTLEVTQDASGNHTVTLGTGFVWGADVTSYSVTATPNKTDYIGLIYSSSAAAWRVIAIAKGY